MDTLTNITNLESFKDTLENLGYDVKLNEDSITVKIGTESPFTAIITHNVSRNEFIISCKIAQLREIDENYQDIFMFSALDLNTRILPFSIGIITEVDNPDTEEEETPVVLINSIPLGDLSEQEVDSCMNSLLKAIMASREILKISLK